MKRWVVLFVALLATALSPPAWAHGDIEATSPRDGARVGRAPREIRITLTEAPTPGAEARAIDGCKDRVPGAVDVDGSDIVMSVDDGAPGQWKVSYRAVSSVDGHQTRGKLSFTVAGPKDCNVEEEANEDQDDIDAGRDPGIVQNPDPPDGGSNTWILWVAGGTVAIAALAFVLRRSSQ